MSTKTLMSVEEYLHTEFDGADCEYVEGEIIERNTGEVLHGRMLAWVGCLLFKLTKGNGLQAASIVRIKIAERRYRIPDVSVWRKDADIGDGIPNVVPFLAIEILSPSDRPIELLEKMQDYLGAGIEWIWVVDPYEGRAMVYSRANPAGEATTVLKTENPAIELPLERVLNSEI